MHFVTSIMSQAKLISKVGAEIQAEERREKERPVMRGMIADGGSCIGFEGPGAELVRTNDYN